jgi:putative ABC transport system permease protein
VAIVSLALGIGANSAMFELVNVVRLRSLPVADPERLVEVVFAPPRGRSGSFRGRRPELTYPLWQEIRSTQQAFSGVFAWSARGFNVAPGGEMRIVQGLYVSGGFFDELGVRAIAGRVLTEADDQAGCAAPGAVISHGFWQREYGGRAAVGGTIALEGQRFEIVGITPPGFFGVEVGRAFDVAVPICAEAIIAGGESLMRRRDGWWLAVIGRLKAGWTREQAAAHLRTLSPAMLQATLPPVYAADTIKAYLALRLTAEGAAGVSSLRADYETPLLLLLGATAVVLLIACANLANLMLARATAREREIAVRLAIGASRSRLVRQLLTESIMLAGIGAVAGALIARGLSRVLVSFITTDRNPVFLDFSMDWRMLAFTAGLAVATCLLFGLAPAARATRTPPADAMKAGGRGNTADRSRFGIRRVLVGAQVALTLVLLVGAILFGRTLQNLLAVETGFRQDGIVVADIDLRGDVPEQRPLLLRHLLERVRQTPGAEAAAYVRIIPLGGSFSNNDITAEGVASQPENRVVNFNRVSDGYFATMDIPLLAGRDFDARDTRESPRVAIVSERLAERFFGRSNPIGRRFRESADAGLSETVYEIVGLVRNSKFGELREDDEPIAFVAATQHERPDLPAFLVRSATPAPAMIDALKQTFREIQPQIVIQFSVLDQRIRELSLRERLIAMLSAGFGLLAVLLSTIGVYGVMSYMVARRRNEIGVRMALGASRADVSRMILADVGAVLAIGLALGAGLSIAAARSASSLLFQLQPGDPATLVSAVALLGTVGLIAGYLPARRAARIEPLSALREE